MKTAALILLAIVAASCSSDDGAEGTAPRCVVGKVEACACSSGVLGTQSCLTDGTFGECECGQEGDAPDASISEKQPVASAADLGPLPDVSYPTVEDCSFRLQGVNQRVFSGPTTLQLTVDAARVKWSGDVAFDPADPDIGTLIMDEPGGYAVFFEADGCPGRAYFYVVPPDNLLVALEWETPQDAAPGDTFGTDLDLHLVHPGGQWNDRDMDTHWANPSPDWSDAGAATSPTLVQVDDDGGGPEVVLWPTGTVSGSFEVGVHYFATEQLGPSRATVRFYDGSDFLGAFPMVLPGEQAFWRAATITLPDREVEALQDEVQRGFPAR